MGSYRPQGYGSGGASALDGLEDVSVNGQTQGDILYFNGTNWVRLPKGSAGQTLKINSGATAPEWQTVASGAHTVQEWTVQSSSPTDPSSGVGKMYVKTLDSNTEILVIKMKKNGGVVEVQIA